MNTFNADTQQVRNFSKYPFDDSSTMSVYSYTFKPQWIPSICVNVQSAKFPLCIRQFTHSSAQAAKMYIYDNADTVVAEATITRSQNSVQSTSKSVAGGLLSPLLDKYDNVCGQILYSPQFSGFVLNVLITQHLSKMELNKDALILSAQCINCIHVTGCKQVVFNSKYTYNRDVCLVFQRNVNLTGAVKQPEINVYGDKTTLQMSEVQYSQQPTYLKYVNGVDLSGRHLLVKPKVLSNLRVIKDGNYVTFAGVRDAQ